jgi:hypothetical protein
MGGIAYLELTFMAELLLPPRVVQQEQTQKANSFYDDVMQGLSVAPPFFFLLSSF